MGAAVSDKRRSPRISIRERVEFRSSEEKGYGLALDVSLGGLFVRADRPAQAGHSLYVEFSLPGDPPASRRRARGEVAWVSDDDGGTGFGTGTGFGLRFVEIRPDDLRAIESLLRGRA